MIRYQVRSRQLIDIVGDIKVSKIILSPHFQRKLVWRDVHKVDFIKTILLGFPFPEIFIAKGDIDIDRMETTACIVDGQQRLNSIIEYVDNKFSVDNTYFIDLDPTIKENFLKYEIPIIELDIKHDDEQIHEIFKRLNRTFYALSSIEKLSSEYGVSEFMLVAKFICNELDMLQSVVTDQEELGIEREITDSNIPTAFIEWAKKNPAKNIQELLSQAGVFSGYEMSRQVHLNYAINILGTALIGHFGRNLDKEIFESRADIFPEKEEIVKKLDLIAKKILSLKFAKNSMWIKKASMFTIITTFFEQFESVMDIDVAVLKSAFKQFEINIPQDYAISAKEGVNNKKERLCRDAHVKKIIASAVTL